jgi:hypothetical protein
VDGARIAVALAFPAPVDRIIDAVIAENADQLLDVGQMRNVFQSQRIVGQQRGDHQRQGRVLCAGNGDRPVQSVAADDPDLVH